MDSAANESDEYDQDDYYLEPSVAELVVDEPPFITYPTPPATIQLKECEQNVLDLDTTINVDYHLIRCEDDTPELLLDTELLLDNYDVPVINDDNEHQDFQVVNVNLMR